MIKSIYSRIDMDHDDIVVRYKDAYYWINDTIRSDVWNIFVFPYEIDEDQYTLEREKAKELILECTGSDFEPRIPLLKSR